MYAEDQYIQEQFYQNFIKQRPGNIVIYGTGLYTKKLLENINSDRIVGLMDAAKTGETIYGKRVLSYEEVTAVSDVYIVIIARNSVINVIYRRIQDFVTQNNIFVYNVSGKQLLAENINTATKECFQLSIDSLRSKIAEVEVVSFDIFDTLLCRRVLRPIDVFRMIDVKNVATGYIYSTERIKAESELPVENNYDINDIYKQLQKNTGESDDRIELLKKLEIETEKKVLRRREDVCKLLEEVYQLGKKVYLISDMYLPGNLIADILAEKGIVKYHKLYVSTDYKSSKAERLFEVVGKDNDICPEKWLHIGDNQFSDVYAPAGLGINTYKLYSTTEMLEESIYAGVLEKNQSLEENIMISYFAAEAFNSPFGGFEKNGKLKVETPEVLARLIIAPLLMKYMVWMTKHIKKDRNDLVVFPARDGFVLRQIYDEIKKVYVNWELPDSVYLYISRRAMLIAAAKNVDDLKFIIKQPHSGNASERITARFEIPVEEKYEMDKLDEIPRSLWDRLLECCAEERRQYESYLRKLGIYDYEKIAFVDFVAIGTIQEAMQRMMEREMQGYYFLRRKPTSQYTENLTAESLYPMSGDFQEESNVYRFYYFLENILSSYEPSFKRIGSGGELELFKESRTEESVCQLKKYHGAIVEYCMDMLWLYPDISSMDAGVEVYDALLGFFSNAYMDIAPEVLKDIINYDEFLNYTVVDLNR